MARMQNNRGARPAQQQYGPPPKSPLAMGIAIVGWVGAGIILLAIMNSTSSQSRAQARIRLAAAEKQKVIDGRLAEIEKAATADEKVLRKELVVLKSDWETINKQHKKLERTVVTLEKKIPILRKQVEAMGSAPTRLPARQPAPQREDPNGLPAGFDPLGPKLPIGGRPPAPPSPADIAAAIARGNGDPIPDAVAPAVAAVATQAFDAVKYKKMLAERDYLKRLIAKHRGSAKSKLLALMDSGRGPQLHAFYRSASHTPYGAAALFFAAERYYEDGKLTQAAGAYRDCQEQYPGSPYTATIDDRIDQVMDKDRYRRGESEVVPYVKP